jgi:hypothetical protein
MDTFGTGVGHVQHASNVHHSHGPNQPLLLLTKHKLKQANKNVLA